MKVAVVSSKGQITIPRELRQELGLVTGSRVEFSRTQRGVYEFIPLTGSVGALGGSLHRDGPPITVEEMDDAIAGHLAENDRRSRE